MRRMLSRRRLLEHTVAAASGLTVTFLVTQIGCTSNSNMGTSTSPVLPCDGAGGESSLDAGHTHTVCIPLADLESLPPEGANYVTSKNEGHTHQLLLAQTQLQSLAVGQKATFTTSIVEGHTHTFTLERASEATAPSENHIISTN